MKKPPRPKRRIAAPYGTRSGDWHDPHNELINRDFDEMSEEEAERISSSVGASGARRPPSE